jgi:cobalt-zinc-cadmium efflux system outer membrane protein
MKTILFLLFLGLATPAAVAQQQPLTLQRVIDRYINQNLEMQAARYRLERTKADQIAALLRPNPGLTISAENMKIDGATPFSRLYELGLIYTDTIELGGKREHRRRVSDLTVSTAEAQFADTMRRGEAVVKRLYYDAVRARYDVEMAAENQQTFGQLVQFNQTRFQEGVIPESDLIKVRLERMKFDSALKQAQLNLRQAVIRLAAQLGDATFAQQTVAGDLEFTGANPTLESLRQIALAERADILAAEREVDAAKERLALEQARARPDLNPFVGYKRVGVDDTFLVGVSIPLKTRDRNQAGILRAEADIKLADTQLQLTRNRALAEVQLSYEAFQTARQQVQTFRDQLLGEADESRSITLAAYQEGGTQLLSVLEAQRTRAEVRQQYFQTLFDYRSSLVDLELAVGAEIQP